MIFSKNYFSDKSFSIVKNSREYGGKTIETRSTATRAQPKLKYHAILNHIQTTNIFTKKNTMIGISFHFVPFVLAQYFISCKQLEKKWFLICLCVSNRRLYATGAEWNRSGGMEESCHQLSLSLKLPFNPGRRLHVVMPFPSPAKLKFLQEKKMFCLTIIEHFQFDKRSVHSTKHRHKVV